MTDYETMPMNGISDSDYWAVEARLRAELLALYSLADADHPEERERDNKQVGDVLNNAWHAHMTAAEWRAAAVHELGIC